MSLKSPIPVSGAEFLSTLARLVIDHTGGHSRLGCRVRLGAAVTLLALVLRVIASSRPKRNAFQRNPRKIGKVVGEEDTEGSFDEYDIVIVGGGMIQLRCSGSLDRYNGSFPGTAGCVLASRLSEDPNLRVLLIEAGDRYTYPVNPYSSTHELSLVLRMLYIRRFQ